MTPLTPLQAIEGLRLQLETNTGLRNFIITVEANNLHVYLKDINYAHHVPLTFEGFEVKTHEQH